MTSKAVTEMLIAIETLTDYEFGELYKKVMEMARKREFPGKRPDDRRRDRDPNI
jgi:hypothetical protein